MAGAELDQGVVEGVAGGVALRVVRHHGLDRAAALLSKPPGGASQRGRDGGGVLGAVELAVDQAGVVVDDADDLTVPARRVLWRSARAPVAQCPGRSNFGRLERIDVQQGASFGPLVATAAAPLLGAPPARPVIRSSLGGASGGGPLARQREPPALREAAERRLPGALLDPPQAAAGEPPARRR